MVQADGMAYFMGENALQISRSPGSRIRPLGIFRVDHHIIRANGPIAGRFRHGIRQGVTDGRIPRILLEADVDPILRVKVLITTKAKRDFRKDDMRIYEVKDERPPLNYPPYNLNLP